MFWGFFLQMVYNFAIIEIRDAPNTQLARMLVPKYAESGVCMSFLNKTVYYKKF